MMIPGPNRTTEPTIEYSFDGTYQPWPELVTHFEAFLRACGYVLPSAAVTEQIESQ